MNEQEFGRKLKPWLERGAASVGQMQSVRLKAARLRAMDAYREPVRLFGLVTIGGPLAQVLRFAAVQRAMLLLPVLILAAVVVTRSMEDETIDLSELDAQLLTQELPPDAFLDKDFRSWLGKNPG